MVGTSTKAKLNQFLDVVRRQNPNVKILHDAYLTDRMTLEQTKKELIEVIGRSERFYEILNKLRVPNRCAIIALLSSKKVSLFNDSLIKLMQYLFEKKWNRIEQDWD